MGQECKCHGEIDKVYNIKAIATTRVIMNQKLTGVKPKEQNCIMEQTQRNKPYPGAESISYQYERERPA